MTSAFSLTALGLILATFAFAQRLGGWEHKTLARALGAVGGAALVWWSLIFLPRPFAIAGSVLGAGIFVAFIMSLMRLKPAANGVDSSTTPYLRYDGVFAGDGSFMLTTLGGAWRVQLMHLTNAQLDIPVSANNVRAQIRYDHADGESFVVREALWVTKSDFASSAHIESGNTGLLCLCASDSDGVYHVIEDVLRKSSVKALKPGKWRVSISITTDNSGSYQCVGSVTVTTDNRLIYDQPRAFAFESHSNKVRPLGAFASLSRTTKGVAIVFTLAVASVSTYFALQSSHAQPSPPPAATTEPSPVQQQPPAFSPPPTKGATDTARVTKATIQAPPATVHIEQTNSPGAVAAGGNVTVIRGDTAIIRTLSVLVTLDLPTAPEQPTSEAKSAGLSSVMAFFDPKKTRYRMVTDYTFGDWQLDASTHRYSFIYKPEDETQLGGRPVEVLNSLDTMVVNYSEFLRTTGLKLASPQSQAVLTTRVLLNGIEVVSTRENGSVATLTSGQAAINVASLFANLSSTYVARLEALAKSR